MLVHIQSAVITTTSACKDSCYYIFTSLRLQRRLDQDSTNLSYRGKIRLEFNLYNAIVPWTYFLFVFSHIFTVNESMVFRCTICHLCMFLTGLSLSLLDTPYHFLIASATKWPLANRSFRLLGLYLSLNMFVLHLCSRPTLINYGICNRHQYTFIHIVIHLKRNKELFTVQF